jgi:hypothetical protein
VADRDILFRIGVGAHPETQKRLDDLAASVKRTMQSVEGSIVSVGAKAAGCREVNRGPGVRQRLRTHTTCFATQTGSSTLYLGYPQAPRPIWPYALVDEYPDIQATGPARSRR